MAGRSQVAQLDWGVAEHDAQPQEPGGRGQCGQREKPAGGGIADDPPADDGQDQQQREATGQ